MSIDRRSHAGASARALLLSALAVILAGCGTKPPPRDPLPYSPNYSRAGATPGGVVRKGYDVAEARSAGAGVLVPDACITPDVTEQALYLPPGCANNLNLQMMVEREGDLLHGRSTGPAMAAPVARAARRYIDEEPRAQPVREPVAVDTTGTLF